MQNLQLRKAVETDHINLQNIGKLTFFGTFSADNSVQNLKTYLESAFATEKVKSELSDKNSEFYFAELDNKIIGYLKVNFGDSQTEIKSKKSIEIERIYVLKEFHGKSAGQILYEKAIEVAKALEVDFVWLGVWEKNLRAIRFYEKNKFTPFDKHVFKLGNKEQIDIMMKMKLLHI
ncbi:GNAT family N-acetyltransferase [Chryseobacterium sp. 09-1422]|uniref:GNAT family N-acetyltransferase n=1 Tax=Chryseobacterium kimseyorum TaxID=2984028 RepID=A0ABT3I4L1_9FLAO|nr:GNAT family N-acetyltransferase [Chryseobacterium kimseyorum]MCW3170768.1 GNAT family N-acetyltransferase [Chryseobacterium kimseyorum]